jgi:hypothetical protein
MAFIDGITTSCPAAYASNSTSSTTWRTLRILWIQRGTVCSIPLSLILRSGPPFFSKQRVFLLFYLCSREHVLITPHSPQTALPHALRSSAHPHTANPAATKVRRMLPMVKLRKTCTSALDPPVATVWLLWHPPASAVPTVILISLAALLIRVLVSVGPYSGQGAAPKFGDYDAQRHWMELTPHLTPADWYRNTSDNDLVYWALDYSPLFAYQS